VPALFHHVRNSQRGVLTGNIAEFFYHHQRIEHTFNTVRRTFAHFLWALFLLWHLQIRRKGFSGDQQLILLIPRYSAHIHHKVCGRHLYRIPWLWLWLYFGLGHLLVVLFLSGLADSLYPTIPHISFQLVKFS